MALQDAHCAIRLNPRWAKGYGRKGDALLQLGDLEEAYQAYKTASKLDSSNSEFRDRRKQTKRFLAEYRSQLAAKGASAPIKKDDEGDHRFSFFLLDLNHWIV